MSTREHSQPGGLSDRTTATLVGVMYIVGTASGVLSAVVTGGTGPAGPDYVASATSQANELTIGALLILVMGIALAFIPVLMFPVLKSRSPRLAVGYLLFRGALETSTYILIAITWLTLVKLGRDHSPGADAASLEAVGAALAHVGDIAVTTVGSVAFLIGATIFYSALWRSRLVPRWLSLWGLVAVLPYFAQTLLAFFGKGQSTEVMLVAALGIQEMVLAVWLIVRGFRGSDK